MSTVLELDADAFTDVLGFRRGSPDLQSGRDRLEAEAARSRLRTQRLAHYARLEGALRVRDRAGWLLDAYAEGAVCSHPELSELTEKLSADMERWGVDGPVAMLRVGDPPSAPGLLAPLYAGLAAHLRGDGKPAAYLSEDAQHVVRELFGARPDPKLVERCREIADALAARLSVGRTHKGLATAMSLTLAGAEVATIAGALSPWVDVFARRLERGGVTRDEWENLRELRSRTSLDPALRAALAPMLAVLASWQREPAETRIGQPGACFAAPRHLTRGE